tara:strand:- start:1497 stop:3551 length:2055 start_codon:yes stop_codon:yes gene_type:complete
MKKNKKIIVVIQARVNSSRLPNKVLLKLNGLPAIIRMIERVKLSKLVDEIWVVTGESKVNDKLVNILGSSNIKVMRGDDLDVLSRYVKVTKKTGANIIVRLTADCPLIDPNIIDMTIKLLIDRKADYASNILKRTYPDGLDVEAFTSDTLIKTVENVDDKFSKEHVTTYMHGLHKNKYKKGNFILASLEHEADFSSLRWTLDEENDLIFLNRVYSTIDPLASWQQILSHLLSNPLIYMQNRIIPTNQNAVDLNSNNYRRYSKSNKLFDRASKTIPLGSQTFSKSYIQWPKGEAPLFIDRAYGAKVVDPDGNHYIDYVLGLLPIILGYCDEDVDREVIDQIQRGTIYSLPSELEMELAEKLVKIIPSAEMVRFGKNGSDATSAAIRLARAYTDRDLVAVAGYHGWHDWYIASSSRNLGVPKSVEALTFKFLFNDLDSLTSLFKKYPNKFAAVILEPTGLVEPDKGFLKSVKNICEKNGTLLIFDEIISGFRINIGGAQKEYGITPDISCFGKAMANGYPLSAIVGSRKIMNLMEEIFFSTTFGGETLSIRASLATINKIQKLNVINKIKSYGTKLIFKLNNIIKKHGLDSNISVSKVNWWPQLVIKDLPINDELFISIMRQELLMSGLLLGSTFNLSLAHTKADILKQTLEKFSDAMKNISLILNSKDPSVYLKGEHIKRTFKVR